MVPQGILSAWFSLVPASGCTDDFTSGPSYITWVGDKLRYACLT